ncbi:Per1-like [Macleaya cordata]|uniref:Post-GPI attachment to proteins factor 3 n=1 Tax=Macleaya cordata TaxID=56857 RepID=A0A200PNA8_MACCD|nr:Per1-like [Macleaya cordata]
MPNCFLISFFVALSYLVGVLNASIGDSNPHYKSCVEQCEKTGCIGGRCFQQCRFFSDGVSVDGPQYMQEPLYLQWKQFDCPSECKYHCMLDREKEREMLGLEPVKYHGKWPFKRVFGIQEPTSVLFSVCNLAMHFYGWLSFFILLHYKLPLRPKDRKPYYEYTGLWHVYGILAMNAWFWSVVFHFRDVDLTEKLDYSSAVALLGYCFIMSILRAFSVRDEAARVMVAAPLIAFVTTHILYLNFYKFDYGLNMKVCVLMGVAQLVIWIVWGGLTRHPSRRKLWVVTVGSALAMLLELYDFPPYKGFIDAHALWHAATIPLTYLWWSFLKDDAKFRTTNLIKKVK